MPDMTLQDAFNWSEGERARLENENDRLRAVLVEARAEVDRWGYGDFHYGDSPRDEGVLAMLDKIDEALRRPCLFCGTVVGPEESHACSR